MENIALYSVKENLLYNTSRTMWGNCNTNRDVFAAKRAIYTDSYITAQLAQIDAAQALPNDAQRTAIHESIRIDMMAQITVCCNSFQTLKLYIRHAFSKEQFETQYNAAGASLYEESTHNRVSCSAMMAQALQYIDNNTTALMANQNMPADFKDLLTEQTATLNTLSTQYTDARQAASLGAAQKVDANNTIYNQCIAMGLDGQQFFKNTALQSQFSFEAVSSMLSPTGASTAVLTIVNSNTNKGITAQVTNTDTGRTITTEQDGRCQMGSLPADDQTFNITAPGFAPQTITINLKTGTASRQTVELVPIVAAPETQRQPEPENGLTEIVGDNSTVNTSHPATIINS